ncbi:MAG: branched-chain amino acid ABC transporter substrate-binding protein [Planctomycetes bacterium]|nr:branched-chain amino acid ABC transporter substrate-binding protein [Planctomycetota bacterium]
MNRRAFLTTAAALIGPFARAAAPKEKVKIVSSLPRVGSAKRETDAIVNAIRMAIADFEKVVPFEIVLLDRDDAHARTGGWDGRAEADIAEKAVADGDVMAFIGPYNSGAARISSPILNAAGLVQITPSATYPGLTRPSPISDPDEPARYRPGKKITFCRVCPHDASQGPLSADFATEELKVKSVFVLDDRELYGHGVATGFKQRCEELKVKVLGHESIDPAQSDFQKLAKKIVTAAPDLVYFGGTTQSKGGQIAKDLRAEKIGCPLMVPDGCYEQAFVDSAGADVLDAIKCFVTVGGINPEHLKGAGADFAKRYKEKHGKVPTVYAVYGYEAAAVVLEALRLVGKKDREAVRKAVVGTKDFDKGLLGKWSFDEHGDCALQPLTVATVEKGKFKAVKVMGAK